MLPRVLLRGGVLVESCFSLPLLCCYCCLAAKLCLTLCNPMNSSSPPGPSVHGVLQARILEWVATSFSRGSSWPRDRTRISCMGRWVPYHWAAPLQGLLVLSKPPWMLLTWECLALPVRSLTDIRQTLPPLSVIRALKEEWAWLFQPTHGNLCFLGGLGTVWSPVPPLGDTCCGASLGFQWALSVVLPTKYFLIEVKFRYPNVREAFLWTFLVAQLVQNLPVMQEPWWGRPPGEGNSTPLQYPCLGDPVDIRAWRATVHGATESDTTQWLNHHRSVKPFMLLIQLKQRAVVKLEI